MTLSVYLDSNDGRNVMGTYLNWLSWDVNWLCLLLLLFGEAGSGVRYSLIVSSRSLWTMFCLYTMVKAKSRESAVDGVTGRALIPKSFD